MPMTARDRRTLTIGGGIVGVLLVGFLLMNLLSGGGGTQGLPSLGPASRAPSATASISGSPQQQPAPALAGRDPFSIPPGFGGATSTSTGTSGPSGTSSPPGAQTSTSTPTLPGGGSSSRIGGHTVVLESVFSEGGVQHSQVEVDGTVYRPPVGGRFDNGQFKLVSTSGNCATMLFGDQSFTLCAQPQK